jgi:hypothetical protein
MQNTKQYKMVYKLNYAMQLIEMGHKVHMTMPNPKNENFTIWVFLVDETFEQDLMMLVSNGRRRKE